MKKTIAILLFILLSYPLAAQTAASVTPLSVKDGLYRYDGARFVVFSPDPFNAFAIGGGEVQLGWNVLVSYECQLVKSQRSATLNSLGESIRLANDF